MKITVPEYSTNTWLPLGKLMRIGLIFLYVVKDDKAMHTWSIAPELRIQKNSVLFAEFKTILPIDDCSRVLWFGSAEKDPT